MILNITLKPILWITNAHTIHQMGCYKPCNQFMNESFYFSYKIKDKQNTQKIVRLDSRQKKKKNTKT